MSEQPSKQYKSDSLTRFGGEAQYDMAVFDFCDRIIEDSTLAFFYGAFGHDRLAVVQKNLLDLAFLESADEEGYISSLLNSVTLEHSKLFTIGLNETHFDSLKNPFVEALRHSWVEEDVLEEAILLLKPLPVMFSN